MHKNNIVSNEKDLKNASILHVLLLIFLKRNNNLRIHRRFIYTEIAVVCAVTLANHLKCIKTRHNYMCFKFSVRADFSLRF